jgi:glycosyltransferase involved in cell wall biosynthesis
MRSKVSNTIGLAHRVSSIPIAGEIQLIKSLAKRIEAVAEIEDPDMLHAHSPVLNTAAALWAGHKLGLPVVNEVRAFWEDVMVDHRTCSEGSLKYKAIRSLETWACRYAAQIAVICDGLGTELISRGIPENKITIVPNGIHPATFHARNPDCGARVGLGSLTSHLGKNDFGLFRDLFQGTRDKSARLSTRTT